MPLFTTSESLSAALKKDDVVPDVIDEFPVTAILSPSYGEGKDVQFGNELPVSETQSIPALYIAATKIAADKAYTLVVTDPDAPTRGDKKWSEYAHYIATGIKLDASKEGEPQPIDLASAKSLLSYVGPAPPQGTGLHRYVFILFEGESSKTPADRPNWGFGKPGAGVREWIEDQDLKPVGLNFFVAKNE